MSIPRRLDLAIIILFRRPQLHLVHSDLFEYHSAHYFINEDEICQESPETPELFILYYTQIMGIVSSTISCGIEFNTHTTDYKFSVLIIFMIITDLLAYTLSNWVFFENQYYNLCLIVKFYIVFNPVQITEVKNRNQNNHNDACIP